MNWTTATTSSGSGTLQLQRPQTHLLVIDLYDAVPVGVQLLESFSQGAQHDTALDEVVKLHAPLVTPVKDSGAEVAEVHGAGVGGGRGGGKAL